MFTKEIYIRLLNEGTDVCRPTMGKMISEEVFEVLPTETYDLDDEEWEFKPGTVVSCQFMEKSMGNILVAVKEVD